MKNWGIKKRVLFIALLPAFLVSALLAGYLIYTQLRDLQANLIDRGYALVRHLGPASEYGVFSGSPQILNPLVTSLINEPDVRFIKITNTFGEVLAFSGEQGYQESLLSDRKYHAVSIHSTESNSLVFRAPIVQSEFVIDQQLQDELIVLESTDAQEQPVLKDRVIGWITVEFDQSRTIVRRNQLIISSILLAVLVLAGGVFLAIRLGRDVSQPIVTLTDTVREVEEGNLNKKLSLQAGGELDKLASGMNAMIAALKLAQSELQERVDKATRKYKNALSLLASKNIELENARKEAVAASDAKSEFLANVSHEIRNPLNGVNGFLGLLSKTNLDQQQRSYLHTVNVSAKSLLRIISDLLDLSRIEAGKMSLDYKVFSIQELLSDTLALHTPAAAEKGLELKLEVDDQLPKFEEGDPVRIGQVLSNLIGNAIKFTDSGVINIKCLVRENVNRRLVLEFVVTDSGLGIAEQHQSSLYESFYQVDGSTRRNFGGAGLGLSIAKKLVELMGGDIGLQSDPGEGTRVWFTTVLTIPQNETVQSLEKELAEFAAEVNGMVQLEGRLRVLVVDDNEINRNLASTILESYGINVDEADDADTAIKKVRQNDYDMVLMDVHMPKMDGLEATEIIRKLPGKKAEIPVIALTADVITERQQNYFSAGMNDCLAKPIEERALATLLMKWCPGKVEPSLRLHTESDEQASALDVEDGLPILDSVLGLRYASGKNTVWETSLRLLMEKLQLELDKLDILVASGRHSEIADIAHSIKGSANYCGAVALGAVAGRLEKVALDGGTTNGQLGTVSRTFIQAAGELKRYVLRHHSAIDQV